MSPTLFITMGDPAGVGPEVVVKTLAALEDNRSARLVVIGDKTVLEKACQITGTYLTWQGYQQKQIGKDNGSVYELIDLANVDIQSYEPGKLDARWGKAAYQYIEKAVSLCMAGAGQGIVTAPVNKSALHLAGYQFAGHTEILAKLCGAEKVAMLLATKSLRVAHVSTHCSLAEAIKRVQTERIVQVSELTCEALRNLGVARPRLAIAGLNPHAGEGGLFGDEESNKIEPAITQLRQKGESVFGPEPPDTVFWRAAQGQFDAVIAMYHDQGHIAVKMLGFSEGVNITLGLPIIRTSVDHGTAFDIAGKGIADAGSMLAAVELAARLCLGKASGQ